MSLIDVRSRDPVAAWAIARTLPLEGGLVDNPHDPGGITAWGVSLRYALQAVAARPDELADFDIDHDGHVDRRDIAGLTPDLAADIYFDDWWKPGWYGRLAPALVAWKCFDVAVNTGPGRAARLLQQALGDLGRQLVVDGQVGAGTIAAVAAEAARDQGGALVAALRAEQATFYRGLVMQKPDLGRFLPGWLTRAAA